MAVSPTPYRGRFAPSPTGPLPLGSLIAALASYLDARKAGGIWLVRMEDLDPPREEPGAAESILHSLLNHGLTWDEEPMWQGQRSDAYEQALATLEQAGHLFPCDCTRALLGPNGACHGRCANKSKVSSPFALRVALPPDWSIGFTDDIQGPQHWHLGRELPDFVVRRKDGLFAYQLAVVVDDATQGITHVVRGSDLLDSSPRQLYLQQLLGYPQMHYSHIPVITNDRGQKLSKQNQAPALSDRQAPDNLRAALQFLCQQSPPSNLRDCPAILEFAIRHWQAGNIPPRLGIDAATLSPTT